MFFFRKFILDTMAVPFSNTKLRVPKGFQNLLEAFAKEVLRQQPANIYEFGAVFFEEMVKERESMLSYCDQY